MYINQIIIMLNARWLPIEGQQPDCLNSPSSQVAIAQKKKIKNQKFDSEERGYFGVTKKKSPKIELSE